MVHEGSDTPTPPQRWFDVEIEPFTRQQKAAVLRCVRKAYERGWKSRADVVRGEFKVRLVRSTWADIQERAHWCKVELLLSGRYEIAEDRALIVAEGKRSQRKRADKPVLIQRRLIRGTDHTWQLIGRALDRGPLPVDEWMEVISAAYAGGDVAKAIELQAMLDVVSLGASLLGLSSDLASLTRSEQRRAAKRGRLYLDEGLGYRLGAGSVVDALHSYRSLLAETYEVIAGTRAGRGVTYSATSEAKSGHPSSPTIRFLTVATGFIPDCSASKNSEWLKEHWLSKGKSTTSR